MKAKKQEKKKQINVPKQTVIRKIDFRYPALIAIIAFGLYANTIRSEYVLDDWGAITGNQFVQKGFAGIGDLLKTEFWHFSNVSLGYYRPLSPITYAIEHQLLGVRPHVSHFINTLLFSFTGFMLCLLLMELFSGYKRLFALLISLLFIAHPIHTEVVANLKSRDEIMSFLGIISFLFFTLRFYDSPKKIYLVVSLLIYYLALLSKETAITGVILLPVSLYFLKQKTISECIKKTIPFAVAIVIYYFQKYSLLGAIGQPPSEIINYPYVKSEFASCMVLFIYSIKLLLLPQPLIYNYCYNQIPAGSSSNALTWIGFIGLVILAFYTIRETTRKTIVGYALVIFFITLLPLFAFVMTRGGIMAERFLYAPALGFSIIIVYILTKLFKVDIKDSDMQLMPYLKKNLKPFLFVIILFAVFSFKTVDRNKAWRNSFSLYQTDMPQTLNNTQSNFLYGSDLIYKAEAEKDPTKKMEYFQQGVYYLNRSVEIAPKYGAAWCNLGRAYQVIKYIPDSAIYYYKKSIDAYVGGYYISYNNLGMIYQTLGKNALASYYYNKAIESNPTFDIARQNVADLKKSTGLDVHEYPGGEKEY